MTDIVQKQYVLSSAPLELPGLTGYHFEGHWLYVHPGLRCRFAEAGNGEQVCLLGSAFCMDAAGKTPLDDIAAWDGRDPAALTAFWTGRWTLLTGTELVADAGGLMAPFYWQAGDGWRVSSSLALLCRITGQTPGAAVPENGLTWHLLPGARAAGISRLLCTQKLGLGPSLRVRTHQWMTDRRGLTGEEKCRALARLLVNGVSNIHAHSGRRIVLALTGGKDSRLALAALLSAGVPFEAYTAAHPNISGADRRIPPVLAKRFGFAHRYIRPGSLRRRMLEDYDSFTGGNSSGADRLFYAHGQFAGFGEDTLILRSGMFEAGQRYGRSYLRPDIGTIAADLRRYYSGLADPGQAAALERWEANARAYPIDWIDIRDRFYMEQRVGGWAAAIEQSLDMNGFLSIQIANCAAVYSVLLSASEAERAAGTMSYDTIRLLAPGLLEYDINKRTMMDRLGFALTVAKHPVKKLRAYLSRKGRR